MIGLAIFIGGFMGLITSAQLDPISARVERVIDGDTIHVRVEGKSRTGDTVDRYGRWLRYVLLDGDNFNARLIREGYAHAYRRFPFSKRTEFIRLEEQARQRGIGLWNRR